MLAGAMALGGTAEASTPGAPQKIKCPVGGETFTFTGYASYSRWGSLPDGQPVGSAPFPLAIPQCPKNGLPIFDTFDKATVATLTPLVNGPEFDALVANGETQRYLVYWLMTRLGRPDTDRAWVLLNAGWEAKNRGDTARARRYAEEYVAVAGAPSGESLDVQGLKARRVNALRELGRFEEAEAARAALVGAADRGDEERRERAGWRKYLTDMAPVIARRHVTRAPIDLLGERDRTFRCADGAGDLSPFERDYCATPAMKAKADELKKLRGQLSS
jgi:hypothetical protein